MIIKNDNDVNEQYRYWGYQEFCFFLLKYFAQIKNTQALFRYLITPKKA